jgi:hypothetical protein
MTCNNKHIVNTCWLQANWSKASNQNYDEEVGYEKIENNINYGNPNKKLITCIVNILMSSLLWEVIQDWWRLIKQQI